MEDIIVEQTQISEIIDLIEYSEDSPSCLIWTRNFGKGRFVRHTGDIVGSITKYPRPTGGETFYWKFGYKYKSYTNHRVVWTLFNGDIPRELVINHIDNNPLNNKISNLELVTTKENNQKAYFHNGLGLKVCNKSGILGVSDNISHRQNGVYACAHAKYKDETGRSINKYFRYDPLDIGSRIHAFEEAKLWREACLMSLVEKGLAFYNLGGNNE